MSQYEAAPRRPARAASAHRGRRAAAGLTGTALARAIPIGVVVLAAAAGLAWGEDGSPHARAWLKYALLTALVLVGILVSGRAVRLSPPAVLTLAGLGGLALFQTMSIAWSAVPNLARDEALLTVAYAAAFAVPALLLRTREDRSYATVAIAAGSAGIAVFAALALVLRAHPETVFYGGRLNFPVTYPNAQAAIVLLGFWPAIAVAARRPLPTALRAAALGGATAMLCGWLLTQSKGGFVGLFVSAAIVFAISRRRLRLFLPFLVASVLAAIGAAPLTAPLRNQSTLAGFRDSIHHAGAILLLLTLVGCVAGFVYAYLDRRVDVSGGVKAVAGKVAVGVVVLVLVGGPTGYFLAVEGPGPFFARQWAAFKVPARETSGTHLLSLGSNRYDFWRVALSEFADNPLVGAGARGFGPAYLQHGESNETPARAHSLPLDTLAETGLLGMLLLVVVLLPALAASARHARDEITAAAVLGGGAYFVVHSSVDWIWTFPAIGIPAFLLLAAGARGPDSLERRPLARRTTLVAAGACAAVALVAFVPPWLGSRYIQRSVKGGAGVQGDITWAKRLDPLAIEPYLAEATWAGSYERAIEPLEKAAALQPRSFAAHYLLGINLIKVGRLDEARQHLFEAYRLSPRDPYVNEALRLAPFSRPPR